MAETNKSSPRREGEPLASVTFDLITRDIIWGVWGRERDVSRAKRVSVLRIMRGYPDGWLPNSGGWYIVRGQRRRGWAFVAPASTDYQGGPDQDYTPPKRDGGRISAAINLLNSPLRVNVTRPWRQLGVCWRARGWIGQMSPVLSPGGAEGSD